MKINNKRIFFQLIFWASAAVCILAISFFYHKERFHKEDFKDPMNYTLRVPERSFDTETILLEEQKSAPYESPIDFKALWAVNPDIIGWIRVPGTSIDYPILYSGDNSTYLNRSLEGKKDVHGAIFLDMDSQPDFSGRHNLFYGHNMRDGSMFSAVNKFKNENFYNEHRFIELYLPEREIHLEIFAVFPIPSQPWLRMTSFPEPSDFEAFKEKLFSYHKYGGQLPEGIERLYTLITCSYEWEDTRTLLIAKETEQ